MGESLHTVDEKRHWRMLDDDREQSDTSDEHVVIPPRDAKLLWRLAHRRVLIDRRLRQAFSLELVKQPGNKDEFGLEGIVIPDEDGCALQIIDEPNTGLVGAWNKVHHYQRKVRKHARIVAVNGETDPRRMQAMIYTSHELEVQVLNPEITQMCAVADNSWRRRKALKEEARVRYFSKPSSKSGADESGRKRSNSQLKRSNSEALKNLLTECQNKPPASSSGGNLTYKGFIERYSIYHKVALERFQSSWCDNSCGGSLCWRSASWVPPHTSSTAVEAQDLFSARTGAHAADEPIHGLVSNSLAFSDRLTP